MFGADDVGVPLPIIVALLAVSFPAVIALMAWMVRELSKTATQNAIVAQRQEHQEERIELHETRLNDHASRLRKGNL